MENLKLIEWRMMKTKKFQSCIFSDSKRTNNSKSYFYPSNKINHLYDCSLLNFIFYLQNVTQLQNIYQKEEEKALLIQSNFTGRLW